MLAERLTAQLLAGPPARDPVEVAHRLLAVQAQDARGARLAVRARSAGLCAADVDRALSEERSLVITWLNRGTLHLVTREDYPWLHALTTPPQFTSTMRRLSQEGVSPDAAERGVAVVRAALADKGPLTREQLGVQIAAAGKVPQNPQLSAGALSHQDPPAALTRGARQSAPVAPRISQKLATPVTAGCRSGRYTRQTGHRCECPRPSSSTSTTR